MRYDVSELKTLKECPRKWQLSSRNALHLRPKVPASNLAFGSLFHECLHAMYVGLSKPEGPNMDKILEQATRECAGDAVAQKVIRTMLTGYYDQVLFQDHAKYRVLEIEYAIDIPLWRLGQETHPDVDATGACTGTFTTDARVHVCGSIDMIVVDRVTHQIWGMEHKTCKTFRTPVYTMMDEQPRVYELALHDYVMNLNDARTSDVDGPVYTVGGIYLNEVRKLSTKFDYARHACVYSEKSRARLLHTLEEKGMQLLALKEAQEREEEFYVDPAPGFMKCSMCDYASICELVGTEPVDLERVLDEFGEEFEIRSVDHLDEKASRQIDDE